LVEILCSGPCLAVVLEGVEAVKVVRKMIGKTNPLQAAPGTIRDDFCHHSMVLLGVEKRAVDNMIHACDDRPECFGREYSILNDMLRAYQSSKFITHEYKSTDQEITF